MGRERSGWRNNLLCSLFVDIRSSTRSRLTESVFQREIVPFEMFSATLSLNLESVLFVSEMSGLSRVVR